MSRMHAYFGLAERLLGRLTLHCIGLHLVGSQLDSAACASWKYLAAPCIRIAVLLALSRLAEQENSSRGQTDSLYQQFLASA
jgi:hypothetical protein